MGVGKCVMLDLYLTCQFTDNKFLKAKSYEQYSFVRHYSNYQRRRHMFDFNSKLILLSKLAEMDAFIT